MLLTRMYSKLCRASPRFNKRSKKLLYETMARVFHESDWTLMNYGYAPLEPGEPELELEAGEEPERYGMQLYHHLASAVGMSGARVLEVGSGRGGGAHFMRKHFGPRVVIGVDFSHRAVRLCNATYSEDGLDFVAGDAECLPFGNRSFDVVVNVESSHCYPSMDAFIDQVRRVLVPGGHFLWTDFRNEGAVAELYEKLDHSGLDLLRDRTINQNVVVARERDDEQRIGRIRESIPRPLVRPFCEFAGVVGSRIYDQLRSGEVVYKSFVLQKPA